MKIRVYSVPICVFFFQLMLVINLTGQQIITSDPFDSTELKKDYIFQDRLVERLNSIIQLVDQNISTVSFYF